MANADDQAFLDTLLRGCNTQMERICARDGAYRLINHLHSVSQRGPVTERYLQELLFKISRVKTAGTPDTNT